MLYCSNLSIKMSWVMVSFGVFKINEYPNHMPFMIYRVCHFFSWISCCQLCWSVSDWLTDYLWVICVHRWICHPPPPIVYFPTMALICYQRQPVRWGGGGGGGGGDAEEEEESVPPGRQGAAAQWVSVWVRCLHIRAAAAAEGRWV